MTSTLSVSDVGSPVGRRASRRRWSLLSWGLPLGVFTAALVTALSLSEAQYDHVIDQLRGAWRPWAVGILVIGGLLVSVGLPGTIVAVASGVVLGFPLGYPLAVGIVFGAAVLTFAGGRWLAGDGAERHRPGWLARIQRAFNRSDWLVVMLLRLTPVLPFAMVNYTLGRCHVSWPGYLLGTAIGLLPGTAAHVWLGVAGRRLVGGGRLHPLEWALVALGLLAVPVLGWLLIRLVRATPKDPGQADRSAPRGRLSRGEN